MNSRKIAGDLPAEVGDKVLLKTNYFDGDGNMRERVTQHTVLGHRIGFGEPCFSVMCENDDRAVANCSNVDKYSLHLIPFSALIERLPAFGEQLELFQDLC